MFQGRPNLQAIVIIAASICLAYILSAFVKKFCTKIASFDRFKIGNEIALIIHIPVVYTVLMIGLMVAISIFDLPEALHSTLVAILQSINILVWMVFAIRLSKILLQAAAGNTSRFRVVHSQSLPLFKNFALFLIFAFAVYFAFQTWGIDMTAWLASAGVLGIVIGLAAKDSLSNVISGIFILGDTPYKIGDYIVLDTGERGEVTEIGLRSTRMLTRDDVELTIPNLIMGNTKIVNESGGPYQKFRIRIPVGVAYGSSIDDVKSILLEVAGANPLVCKEPEARVRFRRFGASSLDFELLCWVEHPAQRGLAVDELLTAVYSEFKRTGVEIPYSKQDVFIKEVPGQNSGQNSGGESLN